MIFLCYFPTEVIIRLLSFLPPKELASCARLSKRFLAIIQASSILTYALEASKAGLDETYHLNRLDTYDITPAELLADLRRRESGWSTFTWNKHLEIPIGKTYIQMEICGHVFAGGYPRTPNDYGVTAIDVYDFQNDKNNGFVTTLSLDICCLGSNFDAGQDLLILGEMCTLHDPFCKLHIRSLSTGLEYTHAEVKQSILSLPIPHNTRTGYHSAIFIFGDNLLFLQANGRDWCKLTQIKWKTAQTLTVYSGFGTFNPLMISETEILLAGCDAEGIPVVKYYVTNMDEANVTGSCKDKDDTSRSLNLVTFNLPFKNLADADPRTWDMGWTFAKAAFTPKPFSPFVKSSTIIYPPYSHLVAVRIESFYNDLSDDNERINTFDIFIHLETLRKYRKTFSTQKEVSWEDWGPSATRVFRNKYPAHWERRALRGYRVLAPDLPQFRMVNGDGKMDCVILDFNQKAWTSSTPGIVWGLSEVVTQDENKTKITSCLPYRKIYRKVSMASWQNFNIFGIRTNNPFAMLGDDIVCFDVDTSSGPLTKALHVFKF
ncbi:hypothetical protein Clacol_004507 [Clathrus columnatus]|uniref:F-box domain-containing protein n=1 Tax=Clathrus columnatus TaxID=1419009 RepID=A0AAV5ACR7_9AGAM|nr:hypothetical protein Clacol_004507 [Clathrus columnatus]